MMQLTTHRPVYVLVLLALLLATLACAKTETPATHAPSATTTPTTVPAPTPTPGPAATPTPAQTPKTGASAQVQGAGDGPLVAGAPPYLRSKLGYPQELVERYHSSKLALWQKATYGGSFTTLSTSWNANNLMDNKFASSSRGFFGGALIYYDTGLCSMIGREGKFDTCNGTFAHLEDIGLVPGVFERWSQPNPLTYVFTVRKNVLWPTIPPMNRTDRTVTADDIAWYLGIIQKDGVLNVFLKQVTSIEATDKNTVTLKFQSPPAEFLRNLAHPSFGIFPKECYEEKDCLSFKAVSPGPFILKESVARQRAVFERNPEFYLKGLPYLDRSVTIVVPDEAARNASYISGNTDLAGVAPLSLAIMEGINKSNPALRIVSSQTPTAAYTLMPQLKGPLADIRVRRAMTMTMDLPSLWASIFEGYAFFPTIVNRDSFGANYNLALEQAGPWYQFNPTEGKKLLVEAGFPNGFQTSVTTNLVSGERYDMLLYVQAQWRKNLNIDLQIKSVDSASYISLLNGRTWENMYSYLNHVGFWPSADLQVSGLSKGEVLNYQGVDDSVLTDLYAKERAELDPAKRAALLWQFEQQELDQVWQLRIRTHNYFSHIPTWVLNCGDHMVAYCGALHNGTWNAMLDLGKQPKR